MASFEWPEVTAIVDAPAALSPLTLGGMLLYRVVTDLRAMPRWSWALSAELKPEALDAAMTFLVASHDATNRRGSSKGIHLLKGWLPAFPETTGYLIGTLLEYARVHHAPALRNRARALGEWESRIQCEDGGVIEGLVNSHRPPIAFNTGMVLHGWLDLFDEFASDRFLKSAVDAGEFLVANQDPDGAWRKAAYNGIATTYHSRVAWALLRLAATTDRTVYATAAVRHLDWCLAQQNSAGWFRNCSFLPGSLPNTHSIAYTLRGLFEAGLLIAREDYIDAVRLASEQLIRKLEVLGTLPATFDESWQPQARSVCLTGQVQLGDIWIKLASASDDARFLNAGLRAITQVATRQELKPGPAYGALPGSFPITGRYAPVQYLNWATKFLADGLLTVEKSEARRWKTR